MNSVELAMLMVMALMLVIIVGLIRWNIESRNALVLAERAEHAKCIAHIASVTSNKFLADRIRDLADKYDSVEEITVHKNLARTQYTVDGASMPAIWLRHQADLIEGRPKPIIYHLPEEADL